MDTDIFAIMGIACTTLGIVLNVPAMHVLAIIFNLIYLFGGPR